MAIEIRNVNLNSKVINVLVTIILIMPILELLACKNTELLLGLFATLNYKMQIAGTSIRFNNRLIELISQIHQETTNMFYLRRKRFKLDISNIIRGATGPITRILVDHRAHHTCSDANWRRVTINRLKFSQETRTLEFTKKNERISSLFEVRK